MGGVSSVEPPACPHLPRYLQEGQQEGHKSSSQAAQSLPWVWGEVVLLATPSDQQLGPFILLVSCTFIES